MTLVPYVGHHALRRRGHPTATAPDEKHGCATEHQRQGHHGHCLRFSTGQRQLARRHPIREADLFRIGTGNIDLDAATVEGGRVGRRHRRRVDFDRVLTFGQVREFKVRIGRGRGYLHTVT